MQVVWINKDFASDLTALKDATNMLSGNVTADGIAALTRIRTDRAGRFYKSFVLLPSGIGLFAQLTKVLEQHEKDEGFKLDLTKLCSDVTSFALPSASHFKGKDICAPLTPQSRNTKQATAFDQLRNTKHNTGVGATTQEADTCRYLEQAVERRDKRFCEV